LGARDVIMVQKPNGDANKAPNFPDCQDIEFLSLMIVARFSA
jgi:hypothetical protein